MKKQLTMGSLFDGIGGFPLAGQRNGFEPTWASEVEKFPIKVTEFHFPNMQHVGDITQLKGADLPPVDVVCGGSPCQDLSLASGNRKGLDGDRSGLFFEQIRVIKEMRDADAQRRNQEKEGSATRFIRPRFAIWENVPGAFSSANGEDFRTVLEEFCKIHDDRLSVPRPIGGKWKSAGGIVLAGEFSIAWRVLDAQYWGVPQRRRRVYLVTDFAGTSASEILFEQESLLGYFEASEDERKGVAKAITTRTDDTE